MASDTGENEISTTPCNKMNASHKHDAEQRSGCCYLDVFTLKIHPLSTGAFSCMCLICLNEESILNELDFDFLVCFLKINLQCTCLLLPLIESIRWSSISVDSLRYCR